MSVTYSTFDETVGRTLPEEGRVKGGEEGDRDDRIERIKGDSTKNVPWVLP